jgi:hypothetical protein
MAWLLDTIKRKLNGPMPYLLGSFFLILAYQNFSYHNPAHHNPKLNPAKRPETLIPRFQPQGPTDDRIADEMGSARAETLKELQNSNLISLHALANEGQSDHFDIREFAPSRPVHVAFNEDPFRAPEVHSNRISDVGTVWLEREIRPLVKQLEDEWLGQVNGRLRGIFGSFKPVDGEDWPEPGEENGSKSRGPASEPGAFPGMPSIPGMPDFPGAPTSGEDGSGDDYLSLKTITPEEVKLTKANEVTIGFKHGTLVSCEVGSGQSKFKLSRPVSRSSSFDISHESADNRNSIGFRLSW